MKFYGKTKWLKRGVNVLLLLTFRCNLSCAYCHHNMLTGKRPKSIESTLEEWKDFIERFPTKIKEIYISGGESTLITFMPELINWILNRKIHVSLFSNLYDIDLITAINPSFRLKIIATYHISDAEDFDYKYKLLKKKYRIDVDEIDNKRLEYSVTKDLIKEIDIFKESGFRIAPDRRIYLSYYDMYMDKKNAE